MKIDFKELNSILCIIENNIISPKNGAKSVYESLINYSLGKIALQKDLIHGQVLDLKDPFKKLLMSYGNDLTTIAIDFPILLKSKKKNAKTIMICAMDPLSPLESEDKNKSSDFDFNKNIGFWAPFSLIEDWENPIGRSMTSNVSFFSTLLESYNLYVTDIFKIFFRVTTDKGLRTSNSLKEYTDLSIHRKILKEEIDALNPSAIITLGNNSRDSLLKINESENSIPYIPQSWTESPLQIRSWNNSTKIISLPHISGSANGSSAILLEKFDRVVDWKVDDRKTVKIGKIALANI